MDRPVQSFVYVIVMAGCLYASGRAHAQPGTVLSHQKISDTEGGFTGNLDNVDRFGRSVALLGDLDGDGVGDLVVGAPNDDDGGPDRGAVWVLFLNTNGIVKAHQKISDMRGRFTGNLEDGDAFGASVASVGDLDGDGVGDLAVGAFLDDDGGPNRGAVWVLFLNTNGTVRTHQKISDIRGRFTGVLDDDDWFGFSVGSLGDLDGDGVGDLAVGAYRDDDGGLGHGALWVLFLNSDGTVRSHQKISDTEGGFSGSLDTGDFFGGSVVSLGDLDGDGVDDVAVGADGDDDGGTDRGAVWVLFLNPDGTVKSHRKISEIEGGFTGALDDDDGFGVSLAFTGDLDGDGVGDLAAGADGDDDGGGGPNSNRGAVWVLFLKTNGTVKSHQKISDSQGGFTGALDNLDHFGRSVASLGDLDGDGVTDLAVGAPRDDDGGPGHGAVWVLFLDGPPPGTPAELTDFTLLDGELIAGGLLEMRRSDDTHLETQARVTGEVSQPHLLRIRVVATSDVQDPNEIELTFESHITDVEGTVWLFLRNWNTSQMVQVAEFAVGIQDEVHRVILPARRFIRAGNGRIKLRIKKIVFFPFTLNGFRSLIDQVEIRVR